MRNQQLKAVGKESAKERPRVLSSVKLHQARKEISQERSRSTEKERLFHKVVVAPHKLEKIEEKSTLKKPADEGRRI